MNGERRLFWAQFESLAKLFLKTLVTATIMAGKAHGVFVAWD